MNRVEIFCTVVIVLCLLFIFFGIKSLNYEATKMKSKIGSPVIIKEDTLIILNYSLINNSYTLSDGREIRLRTK